MTAFLRFLWEFVVGDDPVIAACVIVSLGLTALVAGAGVSAWWIVPVAVVGVLGVSVWRAPR